MRTNRARSVAFGVAAGLLLSAGVAAARDPLPSTTIGIEWEVLKGWYVRANPEKKSQVWDLYPNKALLCTSAVRLGRPLVSITFDGSAGADAMVLEIATAPLSIAPPPRTASSGPGSSAPSVEMTELVPPWRELEDRLTDFVKAMTAAQDGCPAGKGCWVSSETILTAMNSGGTRWSYCKYDGPGVENRAAVGFWLEREHMALTGPNFDTQVNFGLDLAAFTLPRFSSLYTTVAPQTIENAGIYDRVRSHVYALLPEKAPASGPPPRQLTAADGDMDNVRGFLTFYWFTLNAYAFHDFPLPPKTKVEFFDLRGAGMKNRLYLLVKASINQVFAQLTTAEKAEVERILSVPDNFACALPPVTKRTDRPPSCDPVRMIAWASLRDGDYFMWGGGRKATGEAVEQLTNLIAPTRTEKRVTVVVENRDASNPVGQAFLLTFGTDGKVSLAARQQVIDIFQRVGIIEP